MHINLLNSGIILPVANAAVIQIVITNGFCQVTD